MENRFSFRDLVICSLLIAQIVMVALAMKMFDRQWGDVKRIVSKMDEHTSDLSFIRRQLADGVQMSQKGAESPSPFGSFPDAFERVKKAKANPDYSIGDWFVDAFGTNVPKLTPLVSSDIYGTIVQMRVLESLAIQDPDTLNFKPLLSTGWKIEENLKVWQEYVDKRKTVPLTEDEIRGESTYPSDKEDKDLAAKQAAYMERRLKEGRRTPDIASEKDCPHALKITFSLRKGITFSDGQPFTGDDVVFTFNFIMDEKVAAPRDRAYFEKIKSVEKIGEDQVVFFFKEPYFESFDLAGGMNILPRHFYGRYKNEKGEFTYEKFNQSTGILMGTGPYRLASPDTWTPGKPIELFRNERYWGEPGPFDRIIWRIIEDESVEMTMFKNAEFDFFSALPEQYRDLEKDPKVMERANKFEFYTPRGGYMYIAWNQARNAKPTRFADKRVRQAMTYMTDRQRLCDEIFLSYAEPATGPFFPDTGQADPAIKPYPFDIAKAKALLKEAGYEDRNRDGVVEDPKGVPFKFKFSYPSKSPVFERVVLFLKDSYAQAGVSLEPEPTDWPVMIKKLDNRDFDAISLRWSGGFETDIYQMFHSSQMLDNGDNFMSYVNPQFDRVIEQARITIDKPTRMPLWQQAHRHLHEDQPYTFLMRSKALAFLDKRIQNVQRTKAGLNYVSSWVYPLEWYVPKAQQKWSK